MTDAPPRHDAHLDQFRNMHAGERVFIIGSGASLNQVSAMQLARLLTTERTWGVNLVKRCLAARGMRGQRYAPTFYACSEADYLGMIDTEALGYGHTTQRFYANPTPVNGFPNWVWVPKSAGVLELAKGDIAGVQEPFGWAANGFSVVMDVCVQLSAWMGFDRIYLLGCDNTHQGHCYWEDDPSEKRSLVIEGESARNAERVLAEHGVRLIDCTQGGTLPITKARLEDVLTA